MTLIQTPVALVLVLSALVIVVAYLFYLQIGWVNEILTEYEKVINN